MNVLLRKLSLRGPMFQIYRLTNEPGGLGLSCTSAGLSLAGVALLRKTEAGFLPRPGSQIAALTKAAYGDDGVSRLQPSLGVIAKALNRGDLARATMAAVLSRTPELSADAASRLANAEEVLAKYDPDEPRDWHGRWTTGDDAGSSDLATCEVEVDRRPRLTVADVLSLEQSESTKDDAQLIPAAFTAQGHGAADEKSREQTPRNPDALEPVFEQKYDDLGPVDFSKRVAAFGYWLELRGRGLPPAEKERALAEYNFLQRRLSFWLAYDYKPWKAQLNLESAAMTLYQGAINGGIVKVGHPPASMVDVLGAAWGLDGGAPRIRSGAEPTLPRIALAEVPEEIEGLGGIVNNSKVGIKWWRGLKDQGIGLEAYYGKNYPDATRLSPNSKTFDYFHEGTGEAVSLKTMNTLSVTYIKKPQAIYSRVQRYVDDAVNYVPYTEADVDPSDIESKTIYLAIPEYTSPAQWRQLLRAVIYGKENGVTIVITRIRE